MKLRWISIVTAGVLLGAWQVASADVNCALVRKNMERPGATVEDIATTMIIAEEKIEACLEEDEEGEGAGDDTVSGKKDSSEQ